MPELLTVKDVAELLRVPEAWVYTHAADRDIESVKIGRYVRFTPAAVDEYLERQRRRSGDDATD